EQVRLGGIGHHQGQLSPRTGRVECSLVVPGSEQREDLTAEVTAKKPVDVVQSPDQRRVPRSQDLPPQIALEVGTGAAAGLPTLARRNGEVELIRHGLRERQQERLGGFQLAGVEY